MFLLWFSVMSNTSFIPPVLKVAEIVPLLKEMIPGVEITEQDFATPTVSIAGNKMLLII